MHKEAPIAQGHVAAKMKCLSAVLCRHKWRQARSDGAQRQKEKGPRPGPEGAYGGGSGGG